MFRKSSPTIRAISLNKNSRKSIGYSHELIYMISFMLFFIFFHVISPNCIGKKIGTLREKKTRNVYIHVHVYHIIIFRDFYLRM